MSTNTGVGGGKLAFINYCDTIKLGGNKMATEKNINTIMPGYTHLKNAQPLSLAHYFMAYVEMFNRDKNRFLNNLEKR